MAKRIIGLFLALCLVVGLLPMIALAEEGEAPAITSTLTVSTGTNENLIQWKPELTAGMAPAYAKTTAEGALVLEGATEADYNLKVEWAANGTPTLTLKGATLTNGNANISGIGTTRYNTIAIGGTEAFIVKLQGTNVINGTPTNTSTETAAYRCPMGIYATNAGTLTIQGASQADSLAIDNKGGHGIDKRKNALTIENCTYTFKAVNTKSSAQFGIALQYESAGNEDKTNLTVRNAKLDFELAKNHSNAAILLTDTGDKTSATNVNKNTGDVLFQNSSIRFYRSNGTSSTQVTSSVIAVGSASTLTIDRCDVTVYGRHIVARYAPTILNATATFKPEGGEEAAWDKTAGDSIGTTKITTFKATHTCGTSVADDFDCTTAATCDMCGAALGTAQTAHTPAADDGDCTTAVMCANAGCQKVAIEAKAAHTPAADDGDCTTAIKCTVCGTETTAAKAAHTGGTATCTKKAVCTVCNKEYGELAAHTPAARPSCDVAANCTVCGQEALKAGQHQGGTATCQAKAKCTECGKEYGELAAHKGGTATCKDKAKCTVCGKEYGELLTTHTGGTATCTAKAKCTVCGKEYGELAAHKPAADDGDCTTAIKCTVCQAETTAAKAAHAFANDKDASCDNAGCKHTRTLTTNPSTGDISILLTAAVALTSAVGFAGVTVLRKKEN